MSNFIKLIRIDKRLIHATIALNWCQFLNVKNIVLVDPQYDNDPFLTKVLRLSLSKNMNLEIMDIDSFLAFYEHQSQFEDAQNAIVIFKSVAELVACCEKGFQPQEVQIPNPASQLLIRNLEDYYSENEMTLFKQLLNRNIDLYFQTAPHDAKLYAIFNRLKDKKEN